jgi:hypothetical protein
MKTLSSTIMFALLATTPAFAADAAKTKAEAMSINAAEIKWGPAPPDLPKGAEIAVLHGDPASRRRPVSRSRRTGTATTSI